MGDAGRKAYACTNDAIKLWDAAGWSLQSQGITAINHPVVRIIDVTLAERVDICVGKLLRLDEIGCLVCREICSRIATDQQQLAFRRSRIVWQVATTP